MTQTVVFHEVWGAEVKCSRKNPQDSNNGHSSDGT